MTQTVLIKRSVVANAVPATLAVGELAANVADDPIKIWIGTASGPKRLFEAEAIEDAPDTGVFGRSDGEWVPVPLVESDEPIDPAPNAFWWDSSAGRLFLRYGDQWVEVGLAAGPEGPQGPLGPTGATGATGPTFTPATTGTGSTYVLQTTPTINQPVINGVTDGSNGAAGVVGQYVTATATGSSTIDESSRIGALSLTAGDWDVWGNASMSVVQAEFYGAFGSTAQLAGGWETWPAQARWDLYGTTITAGPLRVSGTTTQNLTMCVATPEGAQPVQVTMWARRVR